MSAMETQNFARVVLLGQRIQLNTQAMLNLLSRHISSGIRDNVKSQLKKSLEDLESCLIRFEKLTGIDLTKAKRTLETCLELHEKNDISALYEVLQKFYREDYLQTLIELAEKNID